ncbi:MAG TPA: putative sulfate/molybdate transporter [Aeromicrobium sp.]|nr:putative sulfate/molybdate transporter [Aeromicrobium sp.]HKY58891.1 putative sulfate/molybdate transporter [Aeromicrobium sp.]
MRRLSTIDRHEVAGAFADVGVLVPIAVALIVTNGLSPTAVLLPAGLLYVAAAWVYRLPVPVQPLKAFGAIAIASGLGVDAIAAGALLMGAIFLILGVTGLIDWAARAFPRPLIRGVQLTVGLLFLKIAYTMVMEPPAAFVDHTVDRGWLVGLSVGCAVLALALRRQPIALVLIVVAVVAIAVRAQGFAWGPAPISRPQLDLATFAAAFVALVIPQLPLTFANSCLATADAARTYFGEAAQRVRPGRLATSLGAANLFAGAIGGMPVCHGAGGMTAHRAFGARTGAAPAIIGATLVVLAIVFGAGLAALLTVFPLPILAGLLAVSGLLHIALLRDLALPGHWVIAVGIGVTGFLTNLAIALGAGLLVWWTVVGIRSRLRTPR